MICSFITLNMGTVDYFEAVPYMLSCCGTNSQENLNVYYVNMFFFYESTHLLFILLKIRFFCQDPYETVSSVKLGVD